MCDSCGCGDADLVPVEVHARILADNDRLATHNRRHFSEAGILAINLMGSPGSGKTALLESTARAIGKTFRPVAISGDLATDRDAARLCEAGILATAITTGNACHLDAGMIHEALHRLALQDKNLLFIENVGNLVCPSVYDLGEALRVVALSITEGEDKPLKYPPMFATADIVLLTKVDLIPYLNVDVALIQKHLAQVMPNPILLPVSSRTGVGIPQWCAWLRNHAKSIENRVSSGFDSERRAQS